MRSNLALVHDSSASPITPDSLSDASGEPRIRDIEVAERLGFANPLMIRKLIERNLAELRTYGAISVTAAENNDPKGRGRPGKVYWLNEGQALVLCALSRTPKAAAVRKQVITVFVDWRAGRLAVVPTAVPAAPIAAKPDSGLDALRQDARALAEAAAALLARVDRQEAETKAEARKAARRLAAPAPAPRPSTVPPGVDGAALLYGVKPIARHLGISPRQAKHRLALGALPSFKMGKTVCSSRAALDDFVAERLSIGEARQ